jgi:hypothetical protein
MVGTRGVLCLARTGCDAVELQSSISPSTARPGCGGRTPRGFALQLLLRWRLQPYTGLRDAFRGSSQPKQREWGGSGNGHSDSHRASSKRRRCRLPH